MRLAARRRAGSAPEGRRGSGLVIERWARPLVRPVEWHRRRHRTRCTARWARPGKYFQDFLNGSWLGHPVHPVLTDVVVGGATIAVILDLLRYFLGVTGLRGRADLVDRPGLAGGGRCHRHRPDRLQGHRHRRRAQRRRLPRRDQHHRDRPLRRLLLPAPGRRSRQRLLDLPGRLPGHLGGRLHRRPRGLQVRLHGQSQRLRRAARRRPSSRRSCPRPSCRRRRPPRPASAPRRWCWCAAATWSAP